jgi:predicted dehydrogenase
MATIGMVGVGGYGSQIFAGALGADGVTIRSIYDINASLAESAAKQAGATVASSFEEMLNDDQIEGVSIVVPNALHPEMVEQAIEAGKHVFVEKPIANTVAEGQAMALLARDAGVVLMVGHNTRRAGGFRAAKQLIDSGEVGTLISLEACFSHSGGLGVGPESWRYSRETCPAVPLIQLGIHPIDTMHNLAGPTKRVSSFMRSSIMPENDDSTVTLLEFESGLLGSLHSHYVIPGANFVNVYGTDANLHVEADRLEKTIRNPYGTSVLPVADIGTQREEITEFGRCMDTGAEPETDAEGAILALAVVEAAIVSATEERIVDIAEVMERAVA